MPSPQPKKVHFAAINKGSEQLEIEQLIAESKALSNQIENHISQNTSIPEPAQEQIAKVLVRLNEKISMLGSLKKLYKEDLMQQYNTLYGLKQTHTNIENYTRSQFKLSAQTLAEDFHRYKDSMQSIQDVVKRSLLTSEQDDDYEYGREKAYSPDEDNDDEYGRQNASSPVDDDKETEYKVLLK